MEVDWPTLMWRRQQAEANAPDAAGSAGVELAYTPTWPAPLQGPSHDTSSYPQPNLYLQLSQILEWEIWNHNRSRVELNIEHNRRAELEAQVWELSHDIHAWQNACHEAYAAIDEHRAENTFLKTQLQAANATVRTQQQVSTTMVISTLSTSF
jgi:hypothetical protein